MSYVRSEINRNNSSSARATGKDKSGEEVLHIHTFTQAVSNECVLSETVKREFSVLERAHEMCRVAPSAAVLESERIYSLGLALSVTGHSVVHSGNYQVLKDNIQSIKRNDKIPKQPTHHSVPSFYQTIDQRIAEIQVTLSDCIHVEQHIRSIQSTDPYHDQQERW